MRGTIHVTAHNRSLPLLKGHPPFERDPDYYKNRYAREDINIVPEHEEEIEKLMRKLADDARIIHSNKDWNGRKYRSDLKKRINYWMDAEL
jgi:hypothetical protein